MRPYRLHRLIERLEQERYGLLSRVEAWPREWLSHKPSTAEWSALEVVDHLRKTELAVMLSCRENLKSREHTVTRSERAKAVALIAMMRLPIKLKVPDPVSFVRPDPVNTLEEVLGSWTASASDLRRSVEAFAIEDCNIGVMFHPAAGWMDIRAALTFLSVHLRHHQFQLQRIKAVCEQNAG
jgi:hypothetical protein